MQQLTTNEQKKIRLALYGPSNTCLSYNALRIAYGLASDWYKIAVISTTGSAYKYSHLGTFTAIGLAQPFSAERFYEAMAVCESAGMEVVILDSISSEFSGIGGLLDQLNEGDYERALRTHRSLLTGIRESGMHVIANVSTKSKLTVKSGGRLSLTQQPVQQQGFDKYFQTILQLDRIGRAIVVKDDTMSLPQKQHFLPDGEVGAQLQRWCLSGSRTVPDSLQWKINGCNSLRDLYNLLFDCDTDDLKVMAAFTKRRLQLQGACPVEEELIDLPF